MLLLIDNYDSFVYNLYHYIGKFYSDIVVKRNDKITIDEIANLKPNAIVISPGPSTPNEAGICLELINTFKDSIPILGVCLGHQAIGQVFGGKIIKISPPMHGKVSVIKHYGDKIFKGIPSKFKATRYHSLIVDKVNLPDSLQITAETEDGIIMGLSHKKYNIHGVQFHPESIASEHGHEIVENFLRLANL